MTDASAKRLTPLVWGALLILGLALGAGNFPFPYLSARNPQLVWNAVIGLPLGLFAASLSLSPRAGITGSRLLLPGILAAALTVELLAQSWWPNSADEYGYVLLARTLLHGRLWNPSPPAPQIFEIAWTFTRNHEWFSQYPPGWPAVLAPFLAAGVPWLANPLLAVLLAVLAAGSLRHAGVPRETAGPLLFLLTFSPFVLFNGACLFSQMLAATLVMAIVCLESRSACRGAMLTRLGLGALFGALLTTRYDVFVLTAAPFVIDRAWRRRVSFLGDAAVMALGGLPFALLSAGYNVAITGNPFRTPYSWVSTGARIGFWGKHVVFLDALIEAALRTLHWAGELIVYTSPVLMLLSAAALAAHVRRRTLRWYDVLLPISVVFFFLYPNNGGHEFGPRYWFFAWPTAVLSIGTALGRQSGANAGWLRAGFLRLHAPTLAAVHAPVYLGATLALAAFNHAYIDQRRVVEEFKPPVGPAVVLIPTRTIVLGPWQTAPIVAHSADFCRNGVDLDRAVLYARADNAFKHGAEFTALACTLIGRHVFRWRPPGLIEPVVCP